MRSSRRRRLRLAASVALLAVAWAAPARQAGAAVPPPKISAPTGVVMDAATGAVLWAKDAHRAVLIASTTKILTALVVEKTYAPLQLLTVPEAAERVDGTRLGFKKGMRVTRHDLLDTLLLMSANDAAETLADDYPDGGRAGFLRAMQATADGLGCTDSTFRDPAGLEAPGHKASAADLAILGRALLRRPDLAAIVAARSARYRWPDGHVQVLSNHNHFVGYGKDPGAIGVKTGYTVRANETIVAAQRRGGRVLIAVALGSTPTGLYPDVHAMLAYGWSVPPAPGAEILGRTASQPPQAGNSMQVGSSLSTHHDTRPAAAGSALGRIGQRVLSRPLPAAVAVLSSLLVLAVSLYGYRVGARRPARARPAPPRR